ncbi:Fe-S cluster assembly protein HesB [Mycetocola sp. 2940]|uniref:Fe-S cluster assembly protein HesB n=1 Tax=Mycetocola sp. 2940 TaxID=3156452 RepID=UPI00339511BA
MLTLTENASTIVRTITTQTAGTEQSGLRISSPAAESVDLAVAVAASPEPQDEVVEVGGARVFLEENAAVVLNDKILDAEVDEAGAVRFAIGDQSAFQS